MYHVTFMYMDVLSWVQDHVDTKSLVCAGAALGGILVWKHYHEVKGCLIAGPYPSVFTCLPLRSIQRAVINSTRRDVRVDWFPLDARMRATRIRFADNGHPVSGAARDAARELIVSAIDFVGATKFEISPGGHTLDESRRKHQHYAVGDLHTSVRDDDPMPQDVITCIDVDYYLKDPEQIFGFVNPAVIHTFSPRAVCGFDGDAPFRILDDHVHYDVSGGASWKHRVWDWTAYGEYLEFAVQSPGLVGSLLSWIGVQKVVYQKVHHSRPWETCPHRALVWLLPQFTSYKICWLPSDLVVRKLSRVDYSDSTRPGWNSLVYQTKDEVRINFGRAGEDACMDMLKSDFDVLMGLQSAQSVTSRMLGMGYNKPCELALVGQYFRKAGPTLVDPHRVSRPSTVKVHWPASFEADVEESSARAYAAPLVTDGNLMPMIKRWECLSDSLERRVTFAKNEVEPPFRYNRLAEEFVRLVVPIPCQGHPMLLEEAKDELSKPSQILAVTNVWETVDMEHRRLIEAFVKNEPTMKNGRIISSFADARFLLKFSTYTLRFRDRVLHAEWNKHWFCPGSTPLELAKKVQEYVGSIHTPCEGDFTNLDGSVSLWLQRRVMNAVYNRYFHPQHRKELSSYTDMMVSCPARAKRFGFRYDAGVGVKSGSPTTCDLNTVAGAFVMYCAIRKALPELTAEEAYQHIGLAFGDDGLFDAAFASAWNKVAKDLGLTLKVEKYQPDKGLVFLARVFPDPWKTLTSFQDPLRTWRKLHLTSRDPTIPLADAAVDRLEGYLVTDALTPITSEYAASLVRLYRPQTTVNRPKRKDRNREVPYWLTIGGAWPQDVADVELMEQCIAARLEKPLECIRSLRIQLSEISDPWAVPVLDHTENPCPYTNTLDSEGQPSEDRVDLRILGRDQHVHRQRANRGVPGQNRRRGEVHDSRSSVRGRNRSGRISRQRSPGVQQVSPRRSIAVRTSNQQLARETEGGRAVVSQRGVAEGHLRAERPGPGPSRRSPKTIRGARQRSG
jgi:hypothetical protein